MACILPLPQALIVVYAFHFPHLLNPQIECSAHRALYRQHILGIVLRGPALCFAAAGFSLFFFPLVSGGAGARAGEAPRPGGGTTREGVQSCAEVPSGQRAAPGLVPRVSGNAAGGKGPPPAPLLWGPALPVNTYHSQSQAW